MNNDDHGHDYAGDVDDSYEMKTLRSWHHPAILRILTSCDDIRSGHATSIMLGLNLSSTPLQTTTYLLGVCLFSISFLVFLNSSVSFVVTDIIGIKDGVGDIVGTLGFVDELVALAACPFWGLLSDRIGVRTVRELIIGFKATLINSLGLYHWICYRWSITIPVRTGYQCLSSALASPHLLQYRRSSNVS